MLTEWVEGLGLIKGVDEKRERRNTHDEHPQASPGDGSLQVQQRVKPLCRRPPSARTH